MDAGSGTPGAPGDARVGDGMALRGRGRLRGDLRERHAPGVRDDPCGNTPSPGSGRGGLPSCAPDHQVLQPWANHVGLAGSEPHGCAPPMRCAPHTGRAGPASRVAAGREESWKGTPIGDTGCSPREPSTASAPGVRGSRGNKRKGGAPKGPSPRSLPAKGGRGDSRLLLRRPGASGSGDAWCTGTASRTAGPPRPRPCARSSATRWSARPG